MDFTFILSVRSMDLFLNLDVQVESRGCDLKKHTIIYSSNTTLILHIHIYKIFIDLYLIFYLRI